MESVNEAESTVRSMGKYSFNVFFLVWGVAIDSIPRVVVGINTAVSPIRLEISDMMDLLRCYHRHRQKPPSHQGRARRGFPIHHASRVHPEPTSGMDLALCAGTSGAAGIWMALPIPGTCLATQLKQDHLRRKGMNKKKLCWSTCGVVLKSRNQKFRFGKFMTVRWPAQAEPRIILQFEKFSLGLMIRRECW